MRTVSFLGSAILVLAVCAATAAASRIPSPANSSKPACFALVGTTAGTPDAAGQFTVVLRLLDNNPIDNGDVAIDFSQCPDLRIASTQPWAGLTVDCANHLVHALTNSNGAATFRILGGSVNAGASPGAALNCLRVYGNGVLIGWSTVQAYDQDGQGGMNSNDVSVLVADLFSGTYFGRSDFDCSQTLGSNDLSLWLSAYFAGGSTASAPAVCGP